jgi:hypothetical protein
MEGYVMAISLKQRKSMKVLDKGYAIVVEKPRLIDDGLKGLKVDDVVGFAKVKNVIDLVYYRVWKVGSDEYQTCREPAFNKCFKIM